MFSLNAWWGSFRYTNIFFDFELLTECVGRNVPIPVVTGISHIYFGVILAFSVFVGISLFRRKTYLFHKKERWVLLIASLCSIVCLHILTSRTGFVAFYSGLAGVGVLYVLRERAWLPGLAIFALIILMPIAAYHASPSFKQRVHVTHWDYVQYTNNNLCNCSVTLRLVVWETTFRVFLYQPIGGVSFADLDEEIRNQYVMDGVNIHTPGLLLGPHNQYLESLAGGGLTGFILLVLLLALPFFWGKKKHTMLFFAFILMITGSLITESFLERQLGVAFFVLFYMLLQREGFRQFFG